MNKQEAISVMGLGIKVTHPHFTPDEYITMRDGYIIDEKQYQLNFNDFWKYRTHESWEQDWIEFQETKRE